MKQTKTSKSRFWKGYAITVVILLLVVSAGLGVFYDFIHSYELSQPHNAADNFVASFEDEQLFQWIRSAAGSWNLVYDSEENAVQAVIRNVAEIEGEYSCQREFGISSDTPIFRLYRGDVWLGRFTLVETKRDKYGFPRWRVEKGEAVSGHFTEGTVSHTIFAPADAQVYVNGIEVRQEDLVSSDEPYGYLHPLDQTDALRVRMYAVEGLFCEPKITCVLDGENCVGETGNSVTRFRLPEELLHSYTFRIPHGAELFVNGNPVSTEYRAQTHLPYTYSVLEASAHNLPSEDEYVIDGLLAKPNVSVLYDGETLDITETECGFRAAYPASRMYSSTVFVPAGSELTVRGSECGALFTGETAAVYPELYADNSASPLYDVYRFSSLFLPLSDVSVRYKGEILAVEEQIKSNEQRMEARYPSSNNPEIQALALAFARDYVNYVAYGYSNTSENLAKALRHVQQGSDLYTRIQRSKIGIDFVTPVSSQTYKQLEITESRQISDRDVYCSISFDIDQYIYRIHRSYIGTMELNCTWINDRWVINEMRITSDN